MVFFFCTYFLKIVESEHCLLNESLRWVKGRPPTMNCGAAVVIIKNKLFETLVYPPVSVCL